MSWIRRNFEDLDNLPNKENNAAYNFRTTGYSWKRPGYKISPWITAERIIKNNIGKSHDNAFSYYLKKFPSNYSSSDIYDAWYTYFHDKWWYRGKPVFYIDNDGLIQENKRDKPKKEVSIISVDYKVEFVHKNTGHSINNFTKVFSKKEKQFKHWNAVLKKYITYNFTVDDEFLYLSYRNKYKAQLEDFIPKIISGYKMVFKSKKDPKFRRAINEKFQKSKRTTKKVSMDEKLFREILNNKKNDLHNSSQRYF